MFRFINNILFIGILVLLSYSCKRPSAKNSYTKTADGYWYSLVSYSQDNDSVAPAYSRWVIAEFKTQRDSVFFDTKNDLRDRFFIKSAVSSSANYLKKAISFCAEGDSMSVLIHPADFFLQQFKSPVPLFCQKDSVIKINFKVKKLLTQQQLAKLTQNIANEEQFEIDTYFGSAKKAELSKDSLGFYWVQKPEFSDTTGVFKGQLITLSYSGGFLNGRMIDQSTEEFKLIYGTPDQLIKGLNNVISRLKKGQTSKIILPSHLAFGENGSSNGSVPPFTPMLYKIKIIDIKTNPEADQTPVRKKTKS